MNSRIRSIFEIIGAFFVDDFYNRLYTNARTMYNTKEGSDHSLTSIYVSQVHLYAKLINKYYTNVISKLQTYFQKHTSNNVISLAQMRDEIIKTYLPSDVVGAIADSRKDALLRHLIIKIVQDFSILITKNHNLKLIIDNRKLDNSGRALQDEVINKILIPLRENFYQEFMSKSIKGKSYSQETVSVEIVNRIRDEKNALQRKVQAQEEQIKKLKAILLRAKEQLMEKNTKQKNTDTLEPILSHRAKPTYLTSSDYQPTGHLNSSSGKDTYLDYKSENEQETQPSVKDTTDDKSDTSTDGKSDTSDNGASMLGVNDFSYSDNEN